MQVVIGNTDVTSAVQESTYKVDSVKKYTSWKTGDNTEILENVHYKVEGSFDMVFLAGYSMEYSAFKTLLDANTSGGVTTLSLTVNNLDEALTTINCVLDIAFSPIKYTRNGSNLTVKRCTVTLREC